MRYEARHNEGWPGAVAEPARRPIRALLVEADPQNRQRLTQELAGYGIACQGAADGESMRRELAGPGYDVIVLDQALPQENGLLLCHRLRQSSDLPLLLYAEPCGPADRALGLELGADDYLTKPLDSRELAARIRAVLRRTHSRQASEPSLIYFDGWRLNTVLHQLHSPAGESIALPNAEFRLLWLFLQRPRRVLDRDQLLESARERSVEAFDRSIDLLVSRLRHKLGDSPRDPRFIKTVRGAGYLFNASTISQHAEREELPVAM